MQEKIFIGQIREFNRYTTEPKEDITLDLIDKKIMYMLGENARLSMTHLAKELRIKRETAAYRVKRMVNSDFLQGYLTLLDHRKLGFKNYMVYLKLKMLSKEGELLNYLKALEEVTRLKNCSGSYDIQVIFSVRTEEEFLAVFGGIIDEHHEMISNYDFMEILQEDFLGLNLLVDENEKKELQITERKGSTFQKELGGKKQSEEIKLDDKDKCILDELKLNGRISIKDLSTKAELTQNAVKERIKKMVCTGVVKRFIPLASLSKLGYQWWKVFLKFKKLDKVKFKTFLHYHPNMLWYMALLGKWDYQISVFAKDNAEFHKVIDDIRTEFADNMISYDSIIIFNQFKYVQRVR